MHTKIVYTGRVKNITLSADDRLLEQARQVARGRSSTLNKMFREWLVEVTADRARSERYRDLMRRLDGVRSGGPFTRAEMNAR